MTQASQGGRLEHWPVSRLKAHPDNWRKHPPAQAAALRAAMDRVGWAGVVVVNERTGHILDGHLRAEVAEAAGKRGGLVPVFVVDLPAEKEAEALLTFDSLGHWAQGDAEELRRLREELAAADGLGVELGAMLEDLEGELRRAGVTVDGAAGQAAEWWVRIECKTVAEQKRLHARFTAEGREVRVLTM